MYYYYILYAHTIPVQYIIDLIGHILITLQSYVGGIWGYQYTITNIDSRPFTKMGIAYITPLMVHQYIIGTLMVSDDIYIYSIYIFPPVTWD